jgi:hypothetical protein
MQVLDSKQLAERHMIEDQTKEPKLQLELKSYPPW